MKWSSLVEIRSPTANTTTTNDRTTASTKTCISGNNHLPATTTSRCKKGRYIVAISDIAKGTTLVNHCSPIVWVILNHLPEKRGHESALAELRRGRGRRIEEYRCCGCTKDLDLNLIKRCGGCKMEIYCSRVCQERAWRVAHRAECALLRGAQDGCRKAPDSTSTLEPHQLPSWRLLLQTWIPATMEADKAAQVERHDQEPDASRIQEKDGGSDKLTTKVVNDEPTSHSEGRAKKGEGRWRPTEQAAWPASLPSRSFALGLQDFCGDRRGESACRAASIRNVCQFTDNFLRCMLESGKMNQLTEVLRAASPTGIVEDLERYMAKICSNSFSITDKNLNEIGVGLYRGANLFNHSCVPNCVAIFEGLDIQIRTIRPVSKDEELTICYIDVNGTSAEREHMLEKQYGFTCGCELCSPLSTLQKYYDAAKTAPVCPNCWNRSRCTDDLLGVAHCISTLCEAIAPHNLPLMWPSDPDVECAYAPGKPCRCTNCGYEADVVCAAEDLVGQLESSVKLLATHSWSPGISVSDDAGKNVEKVNNYAKNELIEKVKAVQSMFHFSNARIYKLLEALLRRFIGQGDWRSAYEVGLLSLPAYRGVYGRSSPQYGLQCFVVGKIATNLDQYLQRAAELLTEAVKVLSITHGCGHTVFKELLALKSGLEMHLTGEQESRLGCGGTKKDDVK